MGFQFSLDTVLRVRVVVEEQEERMLQKILHGIVLARESLAEIEARIAALNITRSASCFKSVIGRDIHAAYAELKDLELNKDSLHDKIKKLEELREKQLAVYSKARQDREVLSTMYEEKRKTHELDMTHIEQKTLDDIFVSRRNRN
jgi:flagellar FliJ protein